MLLHNGFGFLVSPQVIYCLPSFLIRALYVYCVGDAEHMPIDRDFALALLGAYDYGNSSIRIGGVFPKICKWPKWPFYDHF